MTETEAETARRGRPRSLDTLRRDEQVLAALSGAGRPLTKVEVADALGVKHTLAYLSLWRLRHAGQAIREFRDGKHVWHPVTPPIAG